MKLRRGVLRFMPQFKLLNFEARKTCKWRLLAGYNSDDALSIFRAKFPPNHQFYSQLTHSRDCVLRRNYST